MIWKKYVSTSVCYNLFCLIDHASFINFETSIWQCFIRKINLSDNDSVWKCTCFNSTSSNKTLRLLLYTGNTHRQWYSFSMTFNQHSLHRGLLAVRFLFLFEVLSKIGTHLPVSISKVIIPILNCDIRERDNWHTLDNIGFWFKYSFTHYGRPQFRRFLSIVVFNLVT